jgi:putative SOS response-associated peptidase YedK
MCLRYQWEYDSQDRDSIEILAMNPPESEPGDAFPASITPIIILVNGERSIVPSYFGMTPAWAKDPSYGPKYAYNGRSETITEKPTFREAFQFRRCLVKVVAFNENLGRNRWLKVTAMNPDEPLVIAGLYEMSNKHVKTRSHCLVTVPSNDLIEPFNDRMPTILSEEGQKIWLNLETSPLDALGLLEPCPDDWLAIEEVLEESRRKKSRYLDLFDGEDA